LFNYMIFVFSLALRDILHTPLSVLTAIFQVDLGYPVPECLFRIILKLGRWRWWWQLEL